MRSSVLVLAAIGVSCGMASGEVQFHVVGDLFDDAGTTIAGLSADGGTAVGTCVESFLGVPELPRRTEAVRWTAIEGSVPLGPFIAVEYASRATAVSANGSVVVGSQSSPGIAYDRAFRWTAAEGMAPLGDLGGAEPFSRALGVSGDGRVVVGYGRSARGDEAFRWTAEAGMVAIGGFPDQPANSEARDASSDGSVIVGRAAPYGAFRWTQGTGVQLLESLQGGGFSEASAVNGDGTVVVGRAQSALGIEAFRWGGGEMKGLGDLPGGSFYSYASDVSGDGSIVVGWSSGEGSRERAFIWDAAHGMRSLQTMLVQEYDLDLIGWTLSHATAISADGRILAGSGYQADGLPRSWVVQLPEPASMASLAAAAAILVLQKRRRMPHSPART